MIKSIHKHTVSEILDPTADILFLCPIYGRAYSWSLRQWEACFDELIDHPSTITLGTLLCINTSSDSVSAPIVEVADGQEILMTASLLLASFYATLDAYFVYLDDSQRCGYLRIKRMLANTEGKPRLHPSLTSENDKEYRAILTQHHILPGQPAASQEEGCPLRQAFRYFKMRIQQHIRDFSNRPAAILEMMERLCAAVCVHIDAASPEDAYSILHAAGAALPPASGDLLKHVLLTKLLDLGQEKLAIGIEAWDDLSLSVPDSSELERLLLRTSMCKTQRAMTWHQLISHIQRLKSVEAFELLMTLKEDAALAPTLCSSHPFKGEENAAMLLLYLNKNAARLRLTASQLSIARNLLTAATDQESMSRICLTREGAILTTTVMRQIEEKQAASEEVLELLRAAIASR